MGKICKSWEKNHIFVLLCAFFSGVMVILLGSFFVFSMIKYHSEDRNIKNNEIREYQLAIYDSGSKTSSFGTGTLDKRLGMQEFVSIAKPSHVLISNFGSKEFMCKGQCYCEKERRISGGILSRSISFLIPALTTVAAISIAQRHFMEECDKLMKDDCPSESLNMEVDFCEDLGPKDEKQMKDDDEYYKRFTCKGNCILRTGWMPVGTSEHENWNNEYYKELMNILENGACKQYSLELIVASRSSEEARMFFTKNLLDSYCQGLTNFKWKYYVTGNDIYSPICLGGLTYFQNPTVECEIV